MWHTLKSFAFEIIFSAYSEFSITKALTLDDDSPGKTLSNVPMYIDVLLLWFQMTGLLQKSNLSRNWYVRREERWPWPLTSWPSQMMTHQTTPWCLSSLTHHSWGTWRWRINLVCNVVVFHVFYIRKQKNNLIIFRDSYKQKNQAPFCIRICVILINKVEHLNKWQMSF